MLKTKRSSLFRAGGFALAVGFALAFFAGSASAHEGHAGPLIELIKTNDALKAMLPEGAKVTRRKQEVTAEDAAWAREHLGVAVPAGVVPYFLARDEAGQVTGAAMVTDEKFGHGQLALGLGVDAGGKVTLAAVLSVHRKYVPEVTGAVGRGAINELSGLTLAELSAKVGAAKSDTEKDILTRFRDMAANLVVLTNRAAQ